MHLTARRAFMDVGNYTALNSTSNSVVNQLEVLQRADALQRAEIMNGHDVTNGQVSAAGGGTPTAVAGNPPGGQREERFSKTNIYLRGLRETDTDETLKEMVAHVVGADNIKSSRAIIDSRDDTPGSNSSNPNACRDVSDTCPRRKIPRTRSPAKEGYGFIDFKSEEIAQQALDYLKTNEKLRQERPNLEVKFARDNEKDPTNIYLQGMPLGFRQDKELEELFKSQIGGVSSARVMVERRSNDPTGVAFVRFSTPDEAQRAISAVNSGEITIDGVRLEAKLADKHNPDERRRRTRHSNARSATSQNGFVIPSAYITPANYLNYIASNQLAYPSAAAAAAGFYHPTMSTNRLTSTPGGYQLTTTPGASISPAAPATPFGQLAAYPTSLTNPTTAGMLQQQLAASSQNAAMAALMSAASGSSHGAYLTTAMPGTAATSATTAGLGSNSDLTGGGASYQSLILQQQLQNNNYATACTGGGVMASDPTAAAYAQAAYTTPFVVQSPAAAAMTAAAAAAASLHADQSKL